jgi:ABC-type molybdate transport system substrate-binding protein
MSAPAVAVPANTIPPGVTVFCDPTLGAAMRALDPVSQSQAGAPVSVLSAPATLMLAQIQRHTRNDVLFTLSAAMDQAVHLQLVKPETRVDGFSNALVLACRADSAPKPGVDLPGMLAGARIAVTDNTVASGLDGRAVLDANQLTQAAGNRLMGAATTADVVFLLKARAVKFGLVYLTDVRAEPSLAVAATLNASPNLIDFSCAVNANAVSPNAQGLIGIIRSSQGTALLEAAGLVAS